MRITRKKSGVLRERPGDIWFLHLKWRGTIGGVKHSCSTPGAIQIQYFTKKKRRARKKIRGWGGSSQIKY